jgi:phosphoribosyl-AMP cyclohydrolase
MKEILKKLKFNDAGLIPAIAQDEKTGEVLMMAWMNEESLNLTLSSGYATYFSRSRNSLWKKGDTSGHFQKVISIAADCDFDCVLLKVDQTGAACHTGKRNCFFNVIL